MYPCIVLLVGIENVLCQGFADFRSQSGKELSRMVDLLVEAYADAQAELGIVLEQ